jgi:hypothetical protein
MAGKGESINLTLEQQMSIAAQFSWILLLSAGSGQAPGQREGAKEHPPDPLQSLPAYTQGRAMAGKGEYVSLALEQEMALTVQLMWVILLSASSWQTAGQRATASPGN